ncbi:MAG: isocitrate/isopropylmalate dehydrogenase family protein, partial [Acidobacteria bacterium]|nr:isocitrate/isopropylmalate dehydrogenase family protein [Acidobacteriota bacterium]
PDIQGQDKANPCSLVLSAAMLLEWLGDRHGRPEFRRAAEAINRAVDELVKRPETRTGDLGGQLGTRAFTGKLCAEVERSL